jgi:DNA modification methylase
MKPVTPRTVELWPIDRLKPHPDNPRAHPEQQIVQLARSIEKFGFTHSILADENDFTLAGHGVHLAARYLRLPEVPVTVVSGLTETEKRIYLVADNQLAFNSRWDEEKLQVLVADLEKELGALDLTGLRPQEIDRILADLAPEQEGWIDEDEIPATTISITVPGDLFVLDRHRLFCGDARSPESYQRLLQGAPADMTFTDCPYNVDYTQRRRGGARIDKIANDNLGAEFGEFLQSVCVQVLAVTQGAVYMCMASKELHTLHQAFSAAGGRWSTFVIWAKDSFTLGRSDYQRQYECILYGWKKGQDHFWCGARDEGDVWEVPKPKRNRLHPTAKPVCLVERAIRNSSRRGDLVLDPFGGSGSSLIACEKSGRRAAVMELEPKYVDVMIQRWEAYTRREAILERDGRSYAAVTRERSLRAA